VINL